MTFAIIYCDALLIHHGKIIFPIFWGTNFFVFSRVHVTLYPTVSVRWSVGPSVRPSVTHLFFRRFSGSFCITAPAQSHATDSAVYTALFYFIAASKPSLFFTFKVTN